jgi:hypothetical protein
MKDRAAERVTRAVTIYGAILLLSKIIPIRDLTCYSFLTTWNDHDHSSEMKTTADDGEAISGACARQALAPGNRMAVEDCSLYYGIDWSLCRVYL